MADLAAIKATFSEWRMVKTRKTMQLIFEVPLEQGEHVLHVLGMPMPDTEKWCAIALLRAPDNTGSTAPHPAGREPTKAREEVVPHSEHNSLPGRDNAPPPANLERRGQLSEQAKERYRQAPEWQKAAMRASILCGDPQFQQWIRDQAGKPWMKGLAERDVTAAAAYKLRGLLGITSRSEIGNNEDVYKRFIALETEYRQATGQMAEDRNYGD